jgi:flagella basal body P-ring formation protein FlgA
LAAISPDVAAVKAGGGRVIQAAMAQSLQPLVVHAGDTVRLWMQDRTVRIEISGVAERSARSGEQVTVRVTQQSDDGLTVQRIAGIARGPGDVEMDQ